MPATFGLMPDVVAPLLQEYVVSPGVAFKLALAPWQAAKVPAIVGDGFGLMVTA